MYQINVDGRLAYEIDQLEDAERKQAELQRVYPGAKVSIQPTPETVRAVMSAIGRRTSPGKAASSASNLDAGRARRWPVLKPCTCGNDPHTGTCPVRRREQARAKRARG